MLVKTWIAYNFTIGRAYIDTNLFRLMSTVNTVSLRGDYINIMNTQADDEEIDFMVSREHIYAAVKDAEIFVLSYSKENHSRFNEMCKAL